MVGKPPAALFVAIVVLAIGCRRQPNPIIGTWYGSNKLTVTFGADGSFSQTGEKPFAGKWKAEDEKVIVSIDRIDNKPIESGVLEVARDKRASASKADVANVKQLLSHIVFSVSEDGRTVTQSLPGIPSTMYSRTKG